MSAMVWKGLYVVSFVQCWVSVSAFLFANPRGILSHIGGFDSRSLLGSSRIRQQARQDLVMGRIGSRRSIESYGNNPPELASSQRSVLEPYTTSRDTTVTRVSDEIVCFEQEHGFANVSVNIRMTVIRLKDNSLWVHAPIAPTEQCIAMVKSLGEVKHIVLPTTGLEHKIFMAPFVAKFPKAKVWVAPGQWSWPIDLPLGFRVDGVLKDEDTEAPWSDEIEQSVLLSAVGIGKCGEVAFFHRRTATLLVTDAVIYIPEEAPEVLAAYRAAAAVEEDKWRRSALMACFLGPPHTPSFDAIAGRLFVSPVVRTFIYERSAEATLAWVRRLARWRFRQIVPAHLAAPVRAGPADLLAAFRFLEDPAANPLPGGDMRPLNAISRLLTATGLVPPRAFGEA